MRLSEEEHPCWGDQGHPPEWEETKKRIDARLRSQQTLTTRLSHGALADVHHAHMPKAIDYLEKQRREEPGRAKARRSARASGDEPVVYDPHEAIERIAPLLSEGVLRTIGRALGRGGDKGFEACVQMCKKKSSPGKLDINRAVRQASREREARGRSAQQAKKREFEYATQGKVKGSFDPEFTAFKFSRRKPRRAAERTVPATGDLAQRGGRSERFGQETRERLRRADDEFERAIGRVVPRKKLTAALEIIDAIMEGEAKGTMKPKTLVMVRRIVAVMPLKHGPLAGLGMMGKSKTQNPRYRSVLTRSSHRSGAVLSEDTIAVMRMAEADDTYVPRTLVVLEGRRWQAFKRAVGRGWGRVKGAVTGGLAGAALGGAAGGKLGSIIGGVPATVTGGVSVPVGTGVGATIGGLAGGLTGLARGWKSGAAAAEHGQLKRAIRRRDIGAHMAIARRMAGDPGDRPARVREIVVRRRDEPEREERRERGEREDPTRRRRRRPDRVGEPSRRSRETEEEPEGAPRETANA